MFARKDEGPAIDDSEFLPLVEVVLTAFEKLEDNDLLVEELWKHTYATEKKLTAQSVSACRCKKLFQQSEERSGPG